MSFSVAISACMKDVQWQLLVLMFNEVSKVGSTSSVSTQPPQRARKVGGGSKQCHCWMRRQGRIAARCNE
eukprot:12427980-Karenia_brevis.AAC.1